jgi:hypothetical protein
MTVNTELERMRKVAVTAHFMVLSQHLLERLRKTMKTSVRIASFLAEI